MSGQPNFMNRVFKPLIVMIGTVLIMGTVGYGLFSLKPSDSASQKPQVSQSTDGKVTIPEVIVLNASSTPGLARKRAEELKLQNWTISTIGNWTGAPLDKTTVYFPSGTEESAAKLAKVFSADVAPADSSMSDRSLTLVITK